MVKICLLQILNKKNPSNDQASKEFIYSMPALAGHQRLTTHDP
jgi:hypothetical protein